MEGAHREFKLLNVENVWDGEVECHLDRRKCHSTESAVPVTCDRKHTKLLHPVETEQTETSPHEMATYIWHMQCATLLGTASLVRSCNHRSEDQGYIIGRLCGCHALLDSGSADSFVSVVLVRQLGLKGTKHTLTLTTLDRQLIQTGSARQHMLITELNQAIAAIDTNTFVTLDNVWTYTRIPVKEVNRL